MFFLWCLIKSYEHLNFVTGSGLMASADDPAQAFGHPFHGKGISRCQPFHRFIVSSQKKKAQPKRPRPS